MLTYRGSNGELMRKNCEKSILLLRNINNCHKIGAETVVGR